MNRPVFVQGPAFCAGEACSLEMLRSLEGVSDAELADFALKGITVFCRRSQNILDMCAESAAQTLAGANIAAQEVGALVFVNAMPAMNVDEEVALLGRIYNLGIRINTMVALDFLHCSGFSAAIDTAVDLIQRKGKDNVLVVLCGYIPSGVERLRRDLGVVCGDGASSCLVSTRPWGFEFVAAETHTDSQLWETDPSVANEAIQRIRTFHNLRELTRSFLAKALVKPESLSLLIGTCGSQHQLDIAAGAAGVGIDKIFVAPLKKYGHIFSCDSIIALAMCTNDPGIAAGGCLMTVGWSPYVTGLTLLRMRKWPLQRPDFA